MSESIPISELVDRVLAELQRLRYTENTKNTYRRFYNCVLSYAESQGITHYSEAFGRQFFEATYGCAWPGLTQPVPRKFSLMVRYLESLSDVQLHGTVLRRRSRNQPYQVPSTFRAAYDAFIIECGRRGYSKTAERGRRDRERLFLRYLEAHEVTLDTLTAHHISSFVATLMDYHPKTVLGVH